MEIVFDRFEESPSSLASRYVKNTLYSEGNPLSTFELARILHESTFDLFSFLHHQLPPSDSLLQDLAERWEVSLTVDQIWL